MTDDVGSLAASVVMARVYRRDDSTWAFTAIGHSNNLHSTMSLIHAIDGLEVNTSTDQGQRKFRVAARSAARLSMSLSAIEAEELRAAAIDEAIDEAAEVPRAAAPVQTPPPNLPAAGGSDDQTAALRAEIARLADESRRQQELLASLGASMTALLNERGSGSSNSSVNGGNGATVPSVLVHAPSLPDVSATTPVPPQQPAVHVDHHWPGGAPPKVVSALVSNNAVSQHLLAHMKDRVNAMVNAKVVELSLLGGDALVEAALGETATHRRKRRHRRCDDMCVVNWCRLGE